MFEFNHRSRQLLSDSYWHNTQCRHKLIGCVLLFCLIVGCGPQRAQPVDVELAQATLTDVLEHWQQGGSISDLRQQAPEIVVQEALWSNGRVLQEFSLTGIAKAENANWFCDVSLMLASKSGDKPEQLTVTYAVGTDLVLTVFHSMR